MSKRVPHRRRQEKKAAERLFRILRLVDDGYTYEEIGKMLVPNITRQRVGQLVRGAQG
jgi:hypothetical protein